MPAPSAADAPSAGACSRSLRAGTAAAAAPRTTRSSSGADESALLRRRGIILGSGRVARAARGKGQGGRGRQAYFGGAAYACYYSEKSKIAPLSPLLQRNGRGKELGLHVSGEALNSRAAATTTTVKRVDAN